MREGELRYHLDARRRGPRRPGGTAGAVRARRAAGPPRPGPAAALRVLRHAGAAPLRPRRRLARRGVRPDALRRRGGAGRDGQTRPTKSGLRRWSGRVAMPARRGRMRRRTGWSPHPRPGLSRGACCIRFQTVNVSLPCAAHASCPRNHLRPADAGLVPLAGGALGHGAANRTCPRAPRGRSRRFAQTPLPSHRARARRRRDPTA